MKPMEMVERIKKEDPKLLAGVPDQKALRIIRAAFVEVARQIDAIDEGVVRVPGFGNFRARRAEREKDGQKLTVKRVHFQPRKQKAGAKKRPAR